MHWWENRKHILVREKARIQGEFPDNDFSFKVTDDALWISGTLHNSFEFECKYPDSYPSAPPEIFPKDRSSYWVPKHQYVGTGKFCLNIREKTWNSSLSAADIIKSLQALLGAEGIRKIKREDKIILHEDDEPTRLQKLSKKVECIIPSDITLSRENSAGEFNFIIIIKFKAYRCIVNAMTYEDKCFESNEIKKLWGSTSFLSRFKGIWISTSIDNLVTLLHISTLSALKEALIKGNMLTADGPLYKMIDEGQCNDLLVFDPEYPAFVFFLSGNAQKNTIEPSRAFQLDTKTIFERLPHKENEILLNKKATIIGCGSIGSKVAEYLTKCGVGKVVLIDGDILNAPNIARHACQLDDIGFEKVYALASKLQKINPAVQITPIVKNLYVIDPPIEKEIRDSSIIVIATALKEEIFNTFAYSHKIPAIYPKVYPYGFGGEILRIIPHITPCFECVHTCMAYLIEEQFNDMPFPYPGALSYDQTPDGQQLPLPALAIDADFIALITSKMALEILITDDYETFRTAANIILWGNKKEWIFDQDYQCLKLRNGNLKSLENCVVCHGDKVIEKELDKTSEQIDKEFLKIILQLQREHDKDESN